MPGTGTGCSGCLPGLYLISTFALAIVIIIGGTGCQCPLGLELLHLHDKGWVIIRAFQCPLGLELLRLVQLIYSWENCFNALSGLSCYKRFHLLLCEPMKFQCPLGLIPHFYRITFLMRYPSAWKVSMPSRAYTSFLPKQRGVRIIPHFFSFNALSGLYLISTVPLQKPRFYAVSRACFCRYLSEYSDNSRFSCMLTFWTYLMRCTYPWHWI